MIKELLYKFKHSLKKLARKSKIAIIAYLIYNNWRIKKQFYSGARATTSRMTIAESVIYIKSVFRDYLKYSGISTEDLLNKKF